MIGKISVFYLSAMRKNSDAYKVKSGQQPHKDDDSWKKGRVPVDFEFAPEMMVILEEIAKEKNISVSEAGSIVLEEAIKEQMELREVVEKTVGEALEEEFNRLAAPLLSYLARNKGGRGFSN
jgi:hypothetical protein